MDSSMDDGGRIPTLDIIGLSWQVGRQDFWRGFPRFTFLRRGQCESGLSVCPDQEAAGGGRWDGKRICPAEIWGQGSGGRDLGIANEEGQAASGGNQVGCDWQDGFEALDGSEGYDLGHGRKVLGAAGEDIDFR